MNSTTRLCAVIVIYEQQYKSTRTFQSLLSISRRLSDCLLDIIIYDNSPVPQSIETNNDFNEIVYFHDVRNAGVISAYKFAKKYCNEHSINWLLRLDQDSDFDIDLFYEFFLVKDTPGIKAVIPKIVCNGRCISPSYVHTGGRLTQVPQNVVGTIKKRITFINSMSFIKISDNTVSGSLDSIICQLDLSDHEFAYHLPEQSVYVMRITMKHALSIMENKYVTVARYENIIKNEIDFIHRTETLLGRQLFKLRLLRRAVLFFMRGKKKYAKITLKNM